MLPAAIFLPWVWLQTWLLCCPGCIWKLPLPQRRRQQLLPWRRCRPLPLAPNWLLRFLPLPCIWLSQPALPVPALTAGFLPQRLWQRAQLLCCVGCTWPLLVCQLQLLPPRRSQVGLLSSRGCCCRLSPYWRRLHCCCHCCRKLGDQGPCRAVCKAGREVADSGRVLPILPHSDLSACFDLLLLPPLVKLSALQGAQKGTRVKGVRLKLFRMAT